MTNEQRLIEDELAILRKRVAQYEAWFRAIDANSKFDFWFKNADSEYTYVNPHFAANMGRQVCELQNVRPSDIFEEDRLERVITLDEQVMKDRYLKRTIPCNSSGRMQMHEEHRFSVTDEAGEPIGLGCFAFEVTEKSLAEETLHQAEKIADLCSWRWSAGTNLLVSCSEQMADFLGVSMTEAFSVFPQRAATMVLAEDRHVFDIVEDRIKGLSTAGYEIEYRLRKPDGRIIHVREIAEPFSSNETTTEFLGVLQDITREKRAERAMKIANETLEEKVRKRTKELRIAKDKAEAANEVKSQFLATMSHELRTPMNGVLGLAQVLKKTELDDVQREYLDLMYSSGTSLVTILNDILDYSKIEAGVIEFDPKPFSLVNSVREVTSLLSTTADEKGLALKVNLQPGIPDHLIGDAGRIRQVLMNLVGNAIKFTAQGHVAVDVGAILDGDTATIFMKVQDTGIGISKDKLDLIFDEFTQAEQSTTREYGGTGLGLTIVRNIIQAMPGGQVSVMSEPGKGSVFTVTLSLKTTSSAHKEAANSELDGTGILIVTGDQNRAQSLKTNFQAWGSKPHMASNAKQALGLLRRAQQDGEKVVLIVSDYDLGDFTGLDLVRAMQKSNDMSDVKTVLLSPEGSIDQAHSDTHLHVFETDEKLSNIADLKSAVCGYLDQGNAVGNGSRTNPIVQPDITRAAS